MTTERSLLALARLVVFAALASLSIHCGSSTTPTIDGSTMDATCRMACAAPPPGCRYVGSPQCSPPRCPQIACDDAGGTDVPTPMDARGDTCVRNSDCGANRVCQFEMGCEVTVGRCTDATCQMLPVAPQYCGCDGRTIQGTSACLPDRSWASNGPCRMDAGAEAATRFVCGESTCDATREYCQRPRGPGACPPPGSPICPQGCPGCPSLPPPTCAPLPASCTTTPTCDCIAREACGDPRSAVCSGDGSRGITLGCLSA